MKLPLVTVTIPTHDRRELFKKALTCYRNQSYENLELVVAESGNSHSSDLLNDLDNCTYFHGEFKNLAHKRNVMAQAAKGDIICHFDDDDWSGPDRVTNQIHWMLNASLCGYTNVFWWDSVKEIPSLYKGAMWGPTLMYWRDYVLNHPWDEKIHLAEDSAFINTCPSKVQVDAKEDMVVTMHRGNAGRAYGDKDFWPIVPFRSLPQGFRDALEKK